MSDLEIGNGDETMTGFECGLRWQRQLEEAQEAWSKWRAQVDELIRIHQPHCYNCGEIMPGPLGHGHAGKEPCDDCKAKGVSDDRKDS